jgi:hypothetical protein
MASNLRVDQILPSTSTNVAIGTATGSVTLVGSVSGTSITNSGVTTVAAGSASAPSITPTGDSNTGIFFPSADTIAFAEGGVEAARLDSSGRLGIGTINPTSLLHLSSTTTPQLNVQAPTGESQIRISSGTGNYRRILFVDSATTPTKNNFEIAVQEVDNSLFFGPSTTVGGLTFSGSTGLRVDSSGRVTMPSQPAFIASKNSGQTLTSTVNNVVSFDTEVIDIGSNYSSNKFTAPVSGTYQFQFTCMGSSPNAGYLRMSLKKNGSGFYGITYATITVNGYESIVSSSLINLSANDYVEAEIYPSMASFALDNTGTFSGYLVG